MNTHGLPITHPSRKTTNRIPRTFSLTVSADELLTTLARSGETSKTQTVIDALSIMKTVVEASESRDVFDLRILSRYTKSERMIPHGSNS